MLFRFVHETVKLVLKILLASAIYVNWNLLGNHFEWKF